MILLSERKDKMTIQSANCMEDNHNGTEPAITVLQKISVLNRDNGTVFTNTERLDAIACLLRGSGYQRMNTGGLVQIYARKPAEELDSSVVIVSSHVDCEHHITKCFTQLIDADTMLGTFDNAITNAAILHLMLKGNLPDHVLVAFTGDEERTEQGAKDVISFIRENSLKVRNIFVLDVTGEGWNTGSDFTVENDFWDERYGEKVIDLVKHTGYLWNYVPGDPDDIPDYIPKNQIIPYEADEDESWEYDEADLPCFSFCLPTRGEMHSDEGILARVASFRRYTEVLERLLNIPL